MTKILNKNLVKLIEENALALSTIDSKGNPHCIAVGYCRVIKDQILITDNYLVQTISNIINYPFVSLAVWRKDWKVNCEGYEIKGKAKYFKNGKWIEEVRKISTNKNEPCKGALLVKIINIKKLS